MARRKARKARDVYDGARFPARGYWTEGLTFPPDAIGLESACCIAAERARDTGRNIDVRMIVFPGCATRVFTYLPPDSPDEICRTGRDRHGPVISL